MKNQFFAFLFGLVLVLACGPSAFAQTTDGETPAEETVCDPLKKNGVTKGLYGLCVAFCEAQDAETDGFPANPENSHRRSGQRLLDKYRERMGPDDPDMPCLSVPCPCWDEEDLASVTAGNVIADESCAGDGNQPLRYQIQNNDLSTPGEEGGFSTATNQSGIFQCATRDFAPFSLRISEEEFELCTAHIVNQCALIGHTYP